MLAEASAAAAALKHAAALDALPARAKSDLGMVFLKTSFPMVLMRIRMVLCGIVCVTLKLRSMNSRLPYFNIDHSCKVKYEETVTAVY